MLINVLFTHVIDTISYICYYHIVRYKKQYTHNHYDIAVDANRCFISLTHEIPSNRYFQCIIQLLLGNYSYTTNVDSILDHKICLILHAK